MKKVIAALLAIAYVGITFGICWSIVVFVPITVQLIFGIVGLLIILVVLYKIFSQYGERL